MVSTFEDALARPKREKVQVRVLMDSPTPESKSPMTLAKSLTDILNGGKDSIERLAFESDPQSVNRYQAVYRAKLRLLPDSLIKRILIQDDLCSAIVRGRETQMASFGRPRDDRHETGYVIETNVGVLERLTPEQREDVSKRIQRAQKLFWTCGEIDGVDGKDRMCFSDWLQLSTRNAVGLGRIATEIVYSEKLDGGEKEFHHFRPVDVGTIYKATPQKTAAQSLRDQALKMLADINVTTTRRRRRPSNRSALATTSTPGSRSSTGAPSRRSRTTRCASTISFPCSMLSWTATRSRPSTR